MERIFTKYFQSNARENFIFFSIYQVAITEFTKRAIRALFELY